MIDYSNHILKSIEKASAEDVTKSVIKYSIRRNLLWGEYSGGNIKNGYLIGVINEDNSLNIKYIHINSNDSLNEGICITSF